MSNIFNKYLKNNDLTPCRRLTPTGKRLAKITLKAGKILEKYTLSEGNAYDLGRFLEKRVKYLGDTYGKCEQKVEEV